VAFFYIGVRARQMKWIVWGAVYSLPLADLLTWFSLSRKHWVLSLLAATGLGLFSIGHALVSRREYLVRLSVLQERETMDHFDLRNQLEIENGVNVRARKVAENARLAPPGSGWGSNRVK
jgi:hypothetical protein